MHKDVALTGFTYWFQSYLYRNQTNSTTALEQLRNTSERNHGRFEQHQEKTAMAKNAMAKYSRKP
jgi:hypothetical protein